MANDPLPGNQDLHQPLLQSLHDEIRQICDVARNQHGPVRPGNGVRLFHEQPGQKTREHHYQIVVYKAALKESAGNGDRPNQ